MALEGQHGVVADHAASVVGDLDEFFAAGFDDDLDAGGAGVERVFQQFFYDRGGALDHLAGGDLVGDVFGKDVDAAHGAVLSSRFSVLSGRQRQFRRWEDGKAKRRGSIGGEKRTSAAKAGIFDGLFRHE